MDEGGTTPGASTRFVDTRGRTIREHAARGTVVNGVFMVGLSVIGLIRGFLLAHFLTRDDYGIWGLLVVGLGMFATLKQVGIGDRFIQQDEPDQERAFQKAFTIEAVFSSIFGVFIAAIIPLFCILYGQWALAAPAYVSLLGLPATVLQAPLWVYYREMDFVKQRLLQAAEPVVSLVVGLILAIAGAGYWSLVIGVLAGIWTTAFFAIRASRYRFRFLFEPGMFKAYADFSVPLFLASCFLLIMAEAVILLPNWQLGLAAAGAITLSGNITQFTDRVDQIVTGTMYPAICAAKDRLDILAESFVKSNRLALMWAMPFGVGVTLFARDLVHFAIGDTWIPAIGPLEVFGVTAAVGHIGFNWDAYLRAVGNTRPIAWTTGISVVVFLATGVPLLFSNGLVGISLGLAFHVVAVIACRGYYLGRMFRGFNIMRHTLRAIIPTLPATAAVLLVRLVEHGTRTKAEAVGELALYALVTILATALTERPLVREAFGYLRGRSAVAAAA